MPTKNDFDLGKNIYTKSLLVTVVFTAQFAQFTAKMTNSEKAIYFLSFMYCSINSQILIKVSDINHI